MPAQALTNGAADQAIDALNRVTTAGAQHYAQEVKELLGKAVEKKGDRDRARAEYQSYLSSLSHRILVRSEFESV